MSEYVISVEEREPRAVMRMQAASNLERIGEDLGRMFPALHGYVVEHGGQMIGAPYARYLSMDETGIELEAGIPVASALSASGDIQPGQLPGGTVATTWHVGPFESIAAAYRALENWMEANGKRSAGAPWEVYWTDPGEEPDPANYRTEVVWPVADV